jgi:shikimate kinase
MIPGNHIVYLIGFMGSGKSTAGRNLASHLGWSFIDLDDKIEYRAGQTIKDIFSDRGEEFFRKLEMEVLKESGNQENTVISTGGGTPCFGDNMDFMNHTGLTVYLKLTPLQLKSRLADTKEERPLLKDLDDASLISFIEDKLSFREKWYSMADLIVDGFSADIIQLGTLIRNSFTD